MITPNDAKEKIRRKLEEKIDKYLEDWNLVIDLTEKEFQLINDPYDDIFKQPTITTGGRVYQKTTLLQNYQKYWNVKIQELIKLCNINGKPRYWLKEHNGKTDLYRLIFTSL